MFLFAAEWAERRCLDSGVWEGPPPSDASDAAAAAVALQNDADDMQQGWTNYSQCFLPEIRDLMKRLDSGSGQDAEVIHLRIISILYDQQRVAKEPRISRRIIGRNSPMLLE